MVVDTKMTSSSRIHAVELFFDCDILFGNSQTISEHMGILEFNILD